MIKQTNKHCKEVKEVISPLPIFVRLNKIKFQNSKLSKDMFKTNFRKEAKQN